MALTKVSYSMIEGASVNVLDFGAVGNGIANDTVAIQAAIDYADTQTPKPVVHLPAGKYKITASLKLKSNTSIRGDGPYATIIDAASLPANTSAIRPDFGENPTYSQRTIGWDLRDFFISGNQASFVTGSKGVNMGSTGYCYIANVWVYYMDTCFWTTNNGYYNKWENIKAYGNVGMYLQSDGGANSIINPTVQFYQKGIWVDTGDFDMYGGSVEQWDATGSTCWCLYVGRTPSDGTGATLRTTNTYFEVYDTFGIAAEYFDTADRCVLTSIVRRGFGGDIITSTPNDPNQLYLQEFLGYFNPNISTVQVGFGSAYNGPINVYAKAQSGNLLQILNATQTDNAYFEAKNVAVSGAAVNPGSAKLAFGSTTSTTVGAAGGASALPATPLGYLIANLGGLPIKIPYYSA